MKKFQLLTLTVSLISSVGFSRSLMMPELEPVLVKGFQQTINLMPVVPPGGHPVRTELEIDVTSNGCTRADDFTVQVTDTGGKQLVRVVRIRPDTCRAFGLTTTVNLETFVLSKDKQVLFANPALIEKHYVH